MKVMIRGNDFAALHARIKMEGQGDGVTCHAGSVAEARSEAAGTDLIVSFSREFLLGDAGRMQGVWKEPGNPVLYCGPTKTAATRLEDPKYLFSPKASYSPTRWPKYHIAALSDGTNVVGFPAVRLNKDSAVQAYFSPEAHEKALGFMQKTIRNLCEAGSPYHGAFTAAFFWNGGDKLWPVECVCGVEPLASAAWAACAMDLAFLCKAATRQDPGVPGFESPFVRKPAFSRMSFARTFDLAQAEGVEHRLRRERERGIHAYAESGSGYVIATNDDLAYAQVECDCAVNRILGETQAA